MKHSNSSGTNRFIAITGAIFFALLLTVAVDRLIPFIHHNGIIFQPHEQVQQKSSEFEFRASVNSLGFRDREYETPKKRFRILAVGNSFTYGWGVALDETWPKVLEGELQKQGMKVEIADLGKPGADPVDYARISDKAIRKLNPDLLLIAVSQGHDLSSLRFRSGFKFQIRDIFTYLYPNLLELNRLWERNTITAADISREQADGAKVILSRLTPAERQKYDNLDSDIKEAFIKGDLNPGLINYGLRYSAKLLDTRNLENPEIRRLIEKMAGQFIKIKQAAEQNNIKVIIVAVPYKCFVSAKGYEVMEREGFLLTKDMLRDDSGDRPIRMASDKAGLPFWTVTPAFREESRHTELYFNLDDHFNAAGQRFFANNLAPRVSEYLDKLPVKAHRQVTGHD